MTLSIAQIITVKCSNLVSDPNLSIWIDLAKQRTSACFYGSNYNTAVALRACHEYTLSKRNANESGPLSGKKMGPVSVSFGSGKLAGGSDLELTTYGKELNSLRKGTGPGISITDKSVTELC